MTELQSQTASHQSTPRIAIVTGATSGLGLEFARQIDARHDVDEIWLVARNQDKLAEIAATLSTPAGPVPSDLSSMADIAVIGDLLERDQLVVGYLINAAGFGRFGAWDAIAEADAEAMIDLNCKGLVALTRTCLPYMERGSHLIQVASAAGFMPLPYLNVYAATKAFVLRYTRGLRWELHGSGIHVTALCPTWVNTGFEEQARKSQDAQAVGHLWFAQSPQEVVKAALRANRFSGAVCCASLPSATLRVLGKVLPASLTMAGWDLLRRL